MTEDEDDHEMDDPTDIVWGVAAIADVINRPPRVASYMLERGLLPAGKMGDRWVSSKRRLRQRIAGAIAGDDGAS